MRTSPSAGPLPATRSPLRSRRRPLGDLPRHAHRLVHPGIADHRDRTSQHRWVDREGHRLRSPVADLILVDDIGKLPAGPAADEALRLVDILATAFFDRLLHHANGLTTEGTSMQLADSTTYAVRPFDLTPQGHQLLAGREMNSPRIREIRNVHPQGIPMSHIYSCHANVSHYPYGCGGICCGARGLQFPLGRPLL